MTLVPFSPSVGPASFRPEYSATKLSTDISITTTPIASNEIEQNQSYHFSTSFDNGTQSTVDFDFTAEEHSLNTQVVTNTLRKQDGIEQNPSKQSVTEVIPSEDGVIERNFSKIDIPNQNLSKHVDTEKNVKLPGT